MGSQKDIHNKCGNRTLKTLGKRRSLYDCVQNILERETNWSKWKENKCFNFEKPKSA